MKCEVDICEREAVVLQIIEHNDEQTYLCRYHLEFTQDFFKLMEWDFDEIYILIWEDDDGDYVL